MPLALAPLRRLLALVFIGAGLVAGHLALVGSAPAGDVEQSHVTISDAPRPKARTAGADRPRYVTASLRETPSR